MMLLNLPSLRLPLELVAPLAEAKTLRLAAARLENRAGERLAAATWLRIKASKIEQAAFCDLGNKAS